MKVKVVLTKGFKKNQRTRTLNLDTRNHSKTAQTSFKDLNLPTENNNVNNNLTLIKNNNNKSKSKNKNNQQTTSKNKNNNHIIIQAKEKIVRKNISQTEDNNNKTVTNTCPYKKINILQEKKRDLRMKQNLSNINIKRYKYNDNCIITEKNKNKNIYYKTPIKIRSIGGGGKFNNKKLKNDSKLHSQFLNDVNFNNIEKNNNNLIIMNLQKELESLKKENSYKTMLITNMTQQIEDYQKQKQILQENNILKEEIQILKDKFNNNQVDNKNINNENKDIDLFDKLKYEYFTSQNQLTELKKENTDLKNNLNNKIINNLNIYVNIKRDIEICLKGKSNPKNINNKNNVNNLNNANKYNINNDLNNYIENKYKLVLQKENEDINNYYKPLKEDQKKEIRFLIKMTLNSNHIKKEQLLNILFNNLINFNDIINTIITECLKTNSTFDKVLLRHYFTSICLNEKNKLKVFNINNLFSEFIYYYNDIDTINTNYSDDKINTFLSNNEKIKQLINECEFKDQFKKGIIELNQFNEIFIGIYGDFINNDKNKEIYILLIYVMKNYYNLNDLGLYLLNYQNLNCDKYNQNVQNINNKKNDNLGKNENNEMQNLIIKKSNSKKGSSKNNSINNSDYSSQRSKIRKKISNEDIVANVSINVEQSTALVNVKFKNHYDSDFENNSVIQTSIYGMNSGKNNDASLIENKNNDDEDNIFITSEDYQVCMDFVSDVFDFCLNKVHRDKKNENKYFEDSI